MFDLTGKTAVITGSSKGIGKSIAMQMALQGAKVVVSSRKVDVCEETAAEINKACEGLDFFLKNTINDTMNKFNRKIKGES